MSAKLVIGANGFLGSHVTRQLGRRSRWGGDIGRRSRWGGDIGRRSRWGGDIGRRRP